MSCFFLMHSEIICAHIRIVMTKMYKVQMKEDGMVKSHRNPQVKTEKMKKSYSVRDENMCFLFGQE